MLSYKSYPRFPVGGGCSTSVLHVVLSFSAATDGSVEAEPDTGEVFTIGGGLIIVSFPPIRSPAGRGSHCRSGVNGLFTVRIQNYEI